MTFKIVFVIFIAVCVFDVLAWPLNLICSFLFLSKYMHNFVLKPLAKYLSVQGSLPTNYLYGKLSNIRNVICVFAIVFNIQLIFILEVIAIAISCKIINNLKAKMGISTSEFAIDDYKTYDDYWKYSENAENAENAEYVPTEEYNYNDVVDGKDVNVNVIYTEKSDNFFGKTIKTKKIKTTQEVIEKIDLSNVNENQIDEQLEITTEELFKEKEIIKEDVMKEDFFHKEFDTISSDVFNKKIDEIKIEPINVSIDEKMDRFDFNTPITPMNISITSEINNDKNKDEKDEVGPDDIRCEKCGAIMPKTKIACSKCGALIKNTYRTGK